MPAFGDTYKLRGLKIKFARHHSLSYSNAHKKLQQSYGGTISEIDNLWTDADQTSISAEISEDACGTTDKTIIPPYFQDCIIRCPQHDDPDTSTPLRRFENALSDAKDNNQPYITLLICIDTWHFKPEFNPSNFMDFQLGEPFAIAPAAMTPVPAQPGATTTPQEAITATQVAIATITALGLTPQNVTPSSTNNANNTDTRTGGNFDQTTGQLFNPNSLPADVKARFAKAKASDVILTKSDRSCYTSTNPNHSVDPSGNTMRKTLHHMNGPYRLVNRSGELFYFSKFDEKNSKTFIARSPKIDSNTPDALRRWYMQYYRHAKLFGIYVHHYFKFRKLTNDSRGFTCGDDTDTTTYDLPLLLDSQLESWNSIIHNSLLTSFTSAQAAQYRVINDTAVAMKRSSLSYALIILNTQPIHQHLLAIGLVRVSASLSTNNLMSMWTSCTFKVTSKTTPAPSIMHQSLKTS